jgi:hypothetical protein
MNEKNVSRALDLLPSHLRISMQLPKYVRVNVIKMSQEEGFEELMKISNLVTTDEHVPYLYSLPPSVTGIILLS